MFQDAVERIGGAVRPMHVIRRRFSDNAVLPDVATLFFVNENGFAVTSKRIANIIKAAANTEQMYRIYLERRSSLPHDESYRFSLKRLESDLKLTKESIVQIRYAFMGCGRGKVKIECIQHPKYDLALLHFIPDQGYLYHEHVTFAAQPPKQGETLCRLGFPLPEFRNFRMNEDTDSIEFTDVGKNISALFALDGTVTRYISDGDRTFGIETTNAGPAGLNGAPLFNRDGLVVGLQSGIGIMLLGADIKMETPDHETFVDHGAMHLAVHTHLDVIKDFLRAQNVTFYEA